MCSKNILEYSDSYSFMGKYYDIFRKAKKWGVVSTLCECLRKFLFRSIVFVCCVYRLINVIQKIKLLHETRIFFYHDNLCLLHKVNIPLNQKGSHYIIITLLITQVSKSDTPPVTTVKIVTAGIRYFQCDLLLFSSS